MKIVLLGPPGSGKGTQAAKLSLALEIPHISTGDIFRANIKNGTELGVLAKSYIDDGKLVPDEITIKIVVDRLQSEDCKEGFIMDGFPRTIPQAIMFDEILDNLGASVEHVINISVSDDTIVKRVSGRRMCSCGMTYHIENSPPNSEGICDACGCKLYVRDDDRKETVKERLRVYHEQSSPLIVFYKEKGILIDIDGMKCIDEITKLILQKLNT